MKACFQENAHTDPTINEAPSKKLDSATAGCPEGRITCDYSPHGSFCYGTERTPLAAANSMKRWPTGPPKTTSGQLNEAKAIPTELDTEEKEVIPAPVAWQSTRTHLLQSTHGDDDDNDDDDELLSPPTRGGAIITRTRMRATTTETVTTRKQQQRRQQQ